MWTSTSSRNPNGQVCAAPSLKDLHSLVGSDEPPSTSSPPIFHRIRIATSTLRLWRSLSSLPSPPDPTIDASPNRIVLYFTSLRIVRKTFDDCREVRSVLRSLRVAVDERDVSMDSRFLDELKGILRRKQVPLPAVFIAGRFVGSADEIRHLHESGDLKRRVEGIPPATAVACESCGGIGFVLCQSCDGSRKCYSDKGGFRSCAACNENGLVRCPECHVPV